MSAKLRERANKLDEMIYSISLLSSEAEEAEIRIKSAMLKVLSQTNFNLIRDISLSFNKKFSIKNIVFIIAVFA